MGPWGRSAWAEDSAPVVLMRRPASDARLGRNLLHILAERPENLVVSPSSIAASLRLAQLGARGSTEVELSRALGSREAGRLDLDDSGATSYVAEIDPPTTRIRLASGAWFQEGIAVAEPYRCLAADECQATVASIDFAGDPSGSTRHINNWVSKATEGRIPNLFADGGLDPDTRLVLTSALAFDAPWATPFSERKTRPDGFRRLDGGEQGASFMWAVEGFLFAEDATASYLCLPFVGGAYAMILALPRDDRPPLDVAPGLIATLQRRKSAPRFETQLVETLIPRFTIRRRLDLSETLRTLGVVSAFDPSRADFGGMTREPTSLALSAAVHEAYVRVNEAGTEAGAATGFGYKITSAFSSSKPRSFRADHPFLFALADLRSGRALFVGQVTDPTN